MTKITENGAVETYYFLYAEYDICPNLITSSFGQV